MGQDKSIRQDLEDVADAANRALRRGRHGTVDGGARAAAGRGQGRPDRAAVGHLHPPGPGDAHGRRDGHRAHQRARRHQVARRRQDEARRDRLRRHHRKGQERGAAHGGAGDRSGCGDRLLSQLLHAGGDRGHRARRTAGADAVLFGSADRARLQIHLPDRGARQPAIGARPARTDEACRDRIRQAPEDGGDADGQHGDLGRDRQGAQGEDSSRRKAFSWSSRKSGRRRFPTPRR